MIPGAWGGGRLVAAASKSDLRGKGVNGRGGDEAMPRGAVRRCRLILRRACRSSASVEVVAPLAVHNGGVWPALRLRAGHALREERGLARRSAGERGCDVLERADLALVAAASARDLRGHGVNVRCCGRRERARRQQGEGSAGSIGAACGRPRFSRVVVPHRRHGRHRWVSVASVAQTVSAHRWHVRRWRAWAASVWNRRHRRHRHVA